MSAELRVRSSHMTYHADQPRVMSAFIILRAT